MTTETQQPALAGCKEHPNQLQELTEVIAALRTRVEKAEAELAQANEKKLEWAASSASFSDKYHALRETNSALCAALDSAELALRLVPYKSRDDAWMALLGELHVAPALEKINQVRAALAKEGEG